MANNKKGKRGKASRHVGYNKVMVRTERMNTSVRLAFCVLALMGCMAFMASALKPYRQLNGMKSDLAEVVNQEAGIIGRKDAKQRELRAIEEDPEYLELIARDRLDYFKPGEYVFRIDR